MKCINCGAEIQPEFKVCPYCGTTIQIVPDYSVYDEDNINIIVENVKEPEKKVEKKPEFAVQAKELRSEIESYLGISGVTGVRVLIRYDVENISEGTYGQALATIFSEPPVDEVFEGTFPHEANDTVFSVEYLPGQFDQRADSAEQCVKLLNETEEPVIKSATTYVISGELTAEQVAAIKSFCINPVDSREAMEEIPETLVTVFETPADVAIFEGFIGMNDEETTELPFYGIYNVTVVMNNQEDYLIYQPNILF